MTISLVLACDCNGNIGLDGDMPWGRSMRADLSRFKELTLHNRVVMGRKTFESIGQALPYRDNYVLTRNKKLSFFNATTLHSPDNINLSFDWFIIGGAKIYDLFLPKADMIYLTMIKEEFDADTSLDLPKMLHFFKLVHQEHHQKDDKNPYDYAFLTYKRK